MATKKTKSSVKSKSVKNAKSKTDIIELILKDHKPLWKLIKTMKSETAKFKEKKMAFKEFAPKLVAHAKPEEKTWYVNMKQEHDMNIEGLEGDVEHALSDQLCEELKTEEEEDLFMAKVKVLAELVEHHLEEEEEELLPQYKKDSSIEERSQLGEVYLELRANFGKENPDTDSMEVPNKKRRKGLEENQLRN